MTPEVTSTAQTEQAQEGQQQVEANNPFAELEAQIAASINGREASVQATNEPSSQAQSESVNNQATQANQNSSAQAPADMSVDGLKFLNEMLGTDYKTVDEAKGLTDALTKSKELDPLRQRMIELEQQLSTKPKTAFANDKIAKLNAFVKANPTVDLSLYSQIESFDTEKSNPIEALKLQLILDNPEFRGKESLVEKSILRKYNVDPETATEEEIEVNQIALITDSKRAIEKIKSLKDIKLEDSEEKPIDPKVLEQQIEEKKNSWKPVVNALPMKIVLPKSAEDKTPLFELEVTAEQQAKIKAETLDFAVSNNIPATQEGLNQLWNYANSLYMAENYMSDMRKVHEMAYKKAEEAIRAEYDNPSTLKNTDKNAQAGGKPKTANDFVSEHLNGSTPTRGW